MKNLYISLFLSLLSFILFIVVLFGDMNAMLSKMTLWVLLALPVFALFFGIFGRNRYTKALAIMISLIAVVVCSGLATVAIFFLNGII